MRYIASIYDLLSYKTVKTAKRLLRRHRRSRFSSKTSNCHWKTTSCQWVWRVIIRPITLEIFIIARVRKIQYVRIAKGVYNLDSPSDGHNNRGKRECETSYGFVYVRAVDCTKRNIPKNNCLLRRLSEKRDGRHRGKTVNITFAAFGGETLSLFG